MITEKNATYLYVANVTTGISDGGTIDVTTLPAGAVVVGKVSGGNLVAVESTALSANETYQIINKLSDGTVLRSPMFKGSDVISKSYLAYTAPQEQVSYLGYNGSSITGLGTITIGTNYIIGLWLNHTKGLYDLKGEVKHISAYATDNTQATVAKLLMESHLKNFSPVREQNPSILCDRIALTSSVAAITGSATIYKLTKGSKTVYTYTKAAAGDATLTASTASVNINDVINIPSYNGRTFTFTASVLGSSPDAGRHVIYIGETAYTIADAGTAAQNATAIANAINAGTLATAVANTASVTITYNENTRALPPMVLSSDNDTTFANVTVTIASGDAVPVKYKVAATTSGAATFELDEPWQGETGYVYEGTTAATNIGIASLTSETWGLKFTGVKQPFNPVTGYPTQVSFDVLTDSFGGYGVEYKAVAPTPGNGTYAQVAELEMYAQGNEQWARNSIYPTRDLRMEANSTYAYNIGTIVVKPSVVIGSTGTEIHSPFTLVIAAKTGLTAPALNTILG